MGCSDTCVYMGEGEGAEVASSRVIRARKPQTCCECNDPIRPGDQYEFTSGRWDGAWSSFRTCSQCREIRDRFACDGYIYGRLWEAIREGMFPCWREQGPFDWLAKIGDSAAAKLTAEYGVWSSANPPSGG